MAISMMDKYILISRIYHLLNDAVEDETLTFDEVIIYLQKLKELFEQTTTVPLEIFSKEFINNLKNEEKT